MESHQTLNDEYCRLFFDKFEIQISKSGINSIIT